MWRTVGDHGYRRRFGTGAGRGRNRDQRHRAGLMCVLVCVASSRSLTELLDWQAAARRPFAASSAEPPPKATMAPAPDSAAALPSCCFDVRALRLAHRHAKDAVFDVRIAPARDILRQTELLQQRIGDDQHAMDPAFSIASPVRAIAPAPM